jgi:hypothetical protein
MNFWIACAVAMILALSASSFRAPFFGDDYGIIALLNGVPATDGSWFDIYRFSSGDPEVIARRITEGWLPWWTHESLRIGFLRPLASVLLAAQHSVFAENPLGYHVISFVLFAMLTVVVGRFFAATVPSGAAALAVVIFALAEMHAEPATWLSNQHATLACLFGVVAVHLHVHGTNRRDRLVAASAVLLSLLSGETAWQVVPYVFVFEAMRASTWREKLRALRPWLVLLVVYVCCHAALGYGAAHTGVYSHPLGNLAEYLRDVSRKGPLLLFLLVSGPVPGMISLAAAGVAAVLFCVWLWLSHSSITPDERRVVRWMLISSVLSVLPALGAPPSGRLLLAPSIGFAVTLGILLRNSVLLAGSFRTSMKDRRARLLVGLAVVSGSVHLVLAPIGFARNVLYMASRAEQMRTEIRPPACGSNDNVAILRASSASLASYGPWQAGVRLMNGEKVTEPWLVLWGAAEPIKILRAAPQSIELEFKHGQVVPSTLAGEAIYRAPRDHLPEGRVVRQQNVTITALRVEEGRARKVRVDFEERTCLVAFVGGRLVTVPWPEGESMIPL